MVLYDIIVEHFSDIHRTRFDVLCFDERLTASFSRQYISFLSKIIGHKNVYFIEKEELHHKHADHRIEPILMHTEVHDDNHDRIRIRVIFG